MVPKDDFSDGEGGWDAIEHVIAEYNFRDGAVPVVVLVQNQEDRVDLNQTLTRDGVLVAMQSKNIVYNTMTVGDSVNPAIFDLSHYGGDSNVRILGVEADASDMVVDGQHDENRRRIRPPKCCNCRLTSPFE